MWPTTCKNLWQIEKLNILKNLKFWRNWNFWFFEKMLKNQFGASLLCFLSDFEYGVEKYFLKKVEDFGFFIFFGSKKLKTHQNNGFWSLGVSKNTLTRWFHAYKWSQIIFFIYIYIWYFLNFQILTFLILASLIFSFVEYYMANNGRLF